MLTINFTNKGLQGPDSDVEAWAKSCVKSYLLLNKKSFTVECCTGLQIDAFRLMVVDKVISHRDIQFKFEGRIIPVDKYGTLKEFPKGFADVIDNFLMRLCRWDKKDMK